jgi:hypothetical protein
MRNTMTAHLRLQGSVVRGGATIPVVCASMRWGRVPYDITNLSYSSTTSENYSISEMRLIKQNVERDGSGTITLFPEEPEDMVREDSSVLFEPETDSTM